MKGDFTRSTFQPKKNYTSVRMQQGRLQLDADWNEQVDILAYLNQIQLQDIIGVSGVPETNGGFKIQTTANNTELTISAGHIYVNGILCVMDEQSKQELFTYNTQPDYSKQLQAETDLQDKLQPGDYLVYLDVWQRHITAIEDPEIREIALVNVPDTATRKKTVCQVKLILESQWEKFKQDREPRKTDTKPSLTANIKAIPGQKLENHLYRIEIQKAGNSNQPATFKWSRDNGSIVSAITDIKEDTDTIIIQNFGRDDLQSFAAGQWVEVTDEVHDLQNRTGTLVRLKSATSGRQLIFDPDTVDGEPITKKNFAFKPKVRRWDNNTDQATIAINAAEWIPLESGIEVKFEANALYQLGDYWQLPVRAEQRIDEIPWFGKPQVAEGFPHYYCELAKVKFTDTKIFLDLKDIRPKFQPLKNPSKDLNNKLDKSGGSLTGALGVGLDSEEIPQARLQVQGEEAKNSNEGTIFSPENKSTEIIETQDVDTKLLKPGDIITAAGQKTAIASIGIGDQIGSVSVKPAFTSVIPRDTKFTYQKPTALFTSHDKKPQLIINAVGDVGIGTVTPTAKLEVAGQVKITDDSTIEKNLNVKDTITTNNLTVSGTFNAEILTGKRLQVSGNGNIDGSLAIANDLNVTDTITTAKLNVTGTFTADTFTGNHLQISGDSNIGGSLAIANNLTVNDTITTANLNVTETFTGNRCQIRGDSSIGGSLAIANNLNVNAKTTTANLEVTNTVQASTLQGNNLQIHSNGNIGGSLAIANDLNVTDTITTANLNVTGTFTGNRFQIRGDSSIGGSLAIANDLTVTDRITTANLNVTGTFQADTFTGNRFQMRGDSSIGGSLAIANDLNVTDTITTANLNVTGTFTGNRCQIRGDSSIGGSLAIANDLTVNGRFNTADLNITGALQADTFTSNLLQIRGNGSIGGSLAIANDLNVTDKTTTANLEVTGTSQITNLQANNLQITGNVGIGVARPLARLHNQGAAPLPGQGQISSNGTTVNGTSTSFNQYLNIGDIITVTNGSTSQSRLITNIAANGNSLTINAPFVPALPTTGTAFNYQQPITRLADSSGVTQFIVTATGNVGIGTSRPDLDTKLHIQGNVRVYGDLFQDSSLELKNNITELSQQEVYEILKALNPVKYSYKDDTEQRLHLGFIAENVPDVLASPDKTAVQPFNILAVLAKAVKDQQAAIATLTNVVKEQQKQIVALTEKTKSLDQKSWWG